MEPTEEEIRINHAVSGAIREGDAEKVRTVLREYPEKLTDAEFLERRFLNASGNPHIGIIEMFLDDLGMDVNLTRGVERATPLSHAVNGNQLGIARLLLSRGADPDIGRPIIAAINRKNRETEEFALEFVRLLVEHGCDVNQRFDLYGDSDNQFTALDWAGQDTLIGRYLRSHGALTSQEVNENSKTVSKATKREKTAAEKLAAPVLHYFHKHFGPVFKKSLSEIVPIEPAITIRVARASGGEKRLTLFSTGMSAEPMSVPTGKEEYQFAELFVELPADWDLMKIGDPEWGWPIHWLRKMAQYPHHNDTWLGGPVTIVDNEDPPEPLAPNVRFTSMLLMAERDVSTSDGRTIQLYRLTPLYPEERDLERREGIAALMRAFDSHDVPFIVDLNRPNVAID